MNKIYITQKPVKLSMNYKSPFLKAVGESPYTKVLDFFLDNEVFDYSKSTIAKEAVISRVTLEPILSQLLKVGIIQQTRKNGCAIMYKFNWENEVANKLHVFDSLLSTPKIPVKVEQ